MNEPIDPTMKGYATWWKEQQDMEKVGKKTPMIVDGDKIVNGDSGIPLAKQGSRPGLIYMDELKENVDWPRIEVNWTKGGGKVDETEELMRVLKIRREASKKALLEAWHGGKQEEPKEHDFADDLSDPTDCPRCRGDKNGHQYVCSPCYDNMPGEAFSKGEFNKYASDGINTQLGVQYPLSFMAEKKAKSDRSFKDCEEHGFMYKGRITECPECAENASHTKACTDVAAILARADEMDSDRCRIRVICNGIIDYHGDGISPNTLRNINRILDILDE